VKEELIDINIPAGVGSGNEVNYARIWKFSIKWNIR
jgi:hypothetical protein